MANPPPTLPPPRRKLQQEPRRIADLPAPARKTATGATIQLLKRCRECGDALPPDAKFCIVCAAPV